MISHQSIADAACSSLTAGYCPDYKDSESCKKHYQKTGGQDQGCYEATTESACTSNGGTWKGYVDKSGDTSYSCLCPEVLNATCGWSGSACYGYGEPCTV